jgi:ankyrin repeat protein
MNPNSKNEFNASKRIKLTDEVANDINSKFKGMIDAIDGCSTTNELMLLLSDCPVETLIKKDDDNKCLLFIACQHNGYESFALRLWQLYPSAAIDQDGWENYRNPLHIACIVGCVDIAEQLLENITNTFLNMTDSQGRTALFYASKLNNVNLAKLLLQNDTVDVNVQDFFGQTALHIGCLHLSFGVIELLLQHKNIQLRLKDNGGISQEGTAIRIFFRTVSMTRLNVLENMHRIFFMFLRLTPSEEMSCDVNGTTGRISVIHEHVEGCWTYFHAFQFLMENGYQSLINQQDMLGRAPLHYACRLSKVEFASNTDHYMIKFMKFPNLLVNIKDNKGRTPLHEACRKCNLKMVTILLTDDNNNVNINLSDNRGNSVLHHAIDGWFNRTNGTDEIDCNNIMHFLLWKNPFIILHRNNQNENALDYVKRVGEEEEVMECELVEELWLSILDLLNESMHKARIKMYKSLMDIISEDNEFMQRIANVCTIDYESSEDSE